MAKKQKQSESLVQPLIRECGKEHVLELLFDKDETKMPTLRSVGYSRIPDSNQWVSFVLVTKGRHVLSIEVDEPNLRSIAEESAKTSFVTQLMGQDL